jgi:hypothetical protein
MEWNGYFYEIVNPLFGRGIFLGMTNPIHPGIAIPLKK